METVGTILNAPFPYFGGKSRAATPVWARFGAVRNYVEPFFGSGAMLLARPSGWTGTETVNDAEGMLSNFWRAVKADPITVAHYADWPVNENDLHARHAWLVDCKESLQARLEGDPDFYDPKLAGWWVWGMACWIAGGFCSGKGPWHRMKDSAGNWILAKRGEGQGVRRQRVELGPCRGVTRQRVHLRSSQGVTRQLVHLGNAGRGVVQGVSKDPSGLIEWFGQLADRLARVRVCCGDWTRVLTRTPTTGQGLTAVFLDPPYADTAGRDPDLYLIDSDCVAHDVRKWAIEHGRDPKIRIALCGYEGEHVMPKSWACVPWKAKGGYSNQKKVPGGHSVNGHRERIWFSPHCLNPASTLARTTSPRVLCHV